MGHTIVNSIAAFNMTRLEAIYDRCDTAWARAWTPFESEVVGVEDETCQRAFVDGPTITDSETDDVSETDISCYHV